MTWDDAAVLVGGVSTLAVFSFLIRENAFYRLFEHLFIGIAAGYLPVLTIKNFLWPKILGPMTGSEVVTFPDGTVVVPYDPRYLLYLAPLAFGLLYYFVYSTRYAWLAKAVIGFSLGASAGLGFKGFFTEMLPQVTGSFKPLLVFDGEGLDLGTTFSNWVFVVTLLSVMSYFFFSLKRAGGSGRVTGLARVLMMVCFGAFFGSTVMARMALLVERVQFLVWDWGGTIGRLAGAAT